MLHEKLTPAPAAFYPSVLSEDRRQDLLAIVNSLDTKEVVVSLYDDEPDINRASFEGAVLPIGKASYLHQLFTGVFEDFNRRYCGYLIEHTIREVRVKDYCGIGDYFDAHADWALVDDPKEHRRLTASLLLTVDYAGADLVIDGGVRSGTAPKEAGGITVFPSTIIHEVEPLTRGRRVALVAFMFGPHVEDGGDPIENRSK